MVRVRTIQFRLTRAQYERIVNDSQVRGFSSLSTYLRYLALAQDSFLEQKVSEIHRHLLGRPPEKARRPPRGRRRPLTGFIRPEA
ncbi:MAG: hypothetical protein WAO20_14470 [Acidobacteriota bacterium]